MKKRNVLTVISILLVAVMAFAVVIGAGSVSYEITDGAVVFNSDKTVSYFNAGGEINNLSIVYDESRNAAVMSVTGNGKDPYALLSYAKNGITTLSADEYKYAVITYMVPVSTSSAATKTEVFYCAGNTKVPTAGSSVTYNITKDGVFHSQIIDFSGIAAWSGTIHALRLDCFTNASAGDTMYVDSVIFAKSEAAAAEVAAYRTNKANGLSGEDSYCVVFTEDNYDSFVTADEQEIVIKGDVNDDGHVNSFDLLVLKKHLACIDVGADLERADISGDGKINLKDSLLLKRAIAGLHDLGNEENTASARVSFENGELTLTALSDTPYVNISYPDGETRYAGQYRYIVITYKTDENVSSEASLYGITDKTSAESAQAHTFTLCGDGKYHSVVIDMTEDASWTGVIDGFKLDFLEGETRGTKLCVESVCLAETATAASALRDYRESAANGVVLTDVYTLDITGQTLGMINTEGTYQNIGPTYNGAMQPFSAAWPQAAWSEGAHDTLLAFCNYNNYIKIADCVDLSKYSEMTITYVTDASYKAYTSEFGFFSEPTVFGQASDSTRNTANLVYSVKTSTPTPQGSSWHNARSTTVAVDSTYCGPVYLSFYMSTGDGAAVTDISFKLKNPVPVEETDTLNNAEGSVVYSVSDDGKTIVANGVTYPNAINYTSGVTLATDDVDRTLYTAEDSQTYNGYDFENKNVGLFYFLWTGSHGTSGPYNIQELVNTYGVGAYELRGDSPVWGPLGAMHHFAEPLYGYYFANDEWVIRKHIEELSNANVDFIYFDVTNGVPYIEAATKVMRVIHEFNEMGYDAPGVVFYGNNSLPAHTGGVSMLQYLYNIIYSKNLYSDTWFRYEGKPVIIGQQAEFNALPSSARDMFTFRQSQWPTEAKKTNAWSWMDFTDKPKPNYNASTGKAEAINVSVAQHLGTIAFGDSGIYGYNITKGGPSIHTTALNHGRNWNGSINVLDEGAYNYGYNFQRQWDTVHDSYPDIPVVMVTGWNEWVAGRQDATNDTQRNPSAKNVAWFVDSATVDFSRDIEMIKGYYFDNYYMQLISNIRRYKGASPTLVQNMRKRIDVVGSFDQWNAVTTSFRDATGDTMARNSTAFGGINYTNTTGRNDIKSSKIVYDTEYLYFYVECNNNITAYNTNSSWMQLYIDVDKSSDTGWYGYDYIVNHKAESKAKTTLAAYSGTNGAYGFTKAESISYKVNGKMMMVKVPLASLGITDYNDISFSFKWADSTTNITTMEQMYTDGDQMPHGRLNYVFANH